MVPKLLAMLKHSSPWLRTTVLTFLRENTLAFNNSVIFLCCALYCVSTTTWSSLTLNLFTSKDRISTYRYIHNLTKVYKHAAYTRTHWIITFNRACKLVNIRLYATLCFNYFRWHRRMFSYGSVFELLIC